MQITKGLARGLLVIACLLQIQCDIQIHRSKPATDEMDPFYGSYVGATVDVAKGEISERDLAVTIKPWKEKGFTIEWSTVTYRANGNEKSATASIDFYNSSRPGIFASAMRTNVFGNVVPYDPVDQNGDPYVWAGLDGETLTVRALYIIDGGEYELHVYKRTLHQDGLALEFRRLSEGEVVTEITALLKPVNT